PYMLGLPQAETERVLREYLAGFDVEVEWGVTLCAFVHDAAGVSASLRLPDGREVTTRTAWVIGCDGAHSTVRHTLGLPFEGEAYPAGFAVGELKLDWSLPDDEFTGFLHPDGVLVAVPLGWGRWRVVVEASAYAAEGALPQPTLDDFQRWMRERGPRG